MLINGQWTQNWQPVQAKDSNGGFVRQQSSFRNTITPTRSPTFPAQQNRYHLYVAKICPWANRTLIALNLKGLQDVISVTVVEPFLTDQGWAFGEYPGSQNDPLYNTHYLHELYTRADSNYTGRATVPVLWDKQTRTIVNNESAEIVRILNTGFGSLASTKIDLYPVEHQQAIDDINKRLYHSFNNGVYRTGFATTQSAYEEAANDVFNTLKWLDKHLATRNYLVANQLTESDIRAFVTLIRFEPAYYNLFKCNQQHLWQYDHIWTYLQRLYAIPEFQQTIDFEHIKQGYYSIKALNPAGIVPLDTPYEKPTRINIQAA